MSHLFTRKPLASLDTGPIDFDLACPTCGYNLRGLRQGQACPECGVPPGRTTPIVDLMLSCSESARARWRTGLALATACVAVALVARIGYFLLSAPGVTPGVVQVYLAIGLLNSVLWIAAVWLVTPASLVEQWPWMNTLRGAARGLSLMWLLGYACLIARVAGVMPGSEGALRIGDAGGRLLGGVGVMCTAFILSWVAEEAELEVPARRLNAAVWLLWFPTLLAQAFPEQIAWFTLVLVAIVLFFWGWLMVLMTLGLHAMERHVRWAGVHAADRMGRAERVDRKRREIEADVAARVRVTPPTGASDVSLDD